MAGIDYWGAMRKLWSETPLTANPSTLFVAGYEKPRLVAFSYVVADAKGPDGMLEARVLKVLVLELDAESAVHDADITVRLAIDSFLLDNKDDDVAGDLDEEELLARLNDMLRTRDYSRADRLISRADHPALLPLYHAVQEWLASQGFIS